MRLPRRRSAPRNDAGGPADRLEEASMKITKIETLHCDAGWRVNSFLKVSTDEGIVGWSEFMEGYGAQGLADSHRKARAAAGRAGPAPGREAQQLPLRRNPPGGGRAQRAGDRRDRERAGRHQGQGARRPGLRTARRSVPRPHAGLLVALRHLPRALRRPHQGMGRGRAGAHLGRCRRARPRGAGKGLQGPQDQPDPLREGPALHVRPRHRRPARLSRAQRRHRHRRRRGRTAFGVPRGRRQGGRAASRHQLQLQDRRLYPAGAGAGAARHGLARDRPLRPAGPRAHPQVRPHADRFARSRSTAGATSARSSRTSRSTTRSSMWRGTASSSR